MQPDPKEKEPAPAPPLPSEQVPNAHAAGDGALERSDVSVEGGASASEDLHAEDQNHIPY
ncbi:MAG: hypothetical protein EOO12_00925 [Chitinophagaceae bacterium]|nr:MAG: hypothetical protein EOO12_00925 [Chitinophagaceae bacterium]